MSFLLSLNQAAEEALMGFLNRFPGYLESFSSPCSSPKNARGRCQIRLYEPGHSWAHALCLLHHAGTYGANA